MTVWHENHVDVNTEMTERALFSGRALLEMKASSSGELQLLFFLCDDRAVKIGFIRSASSTRGLEYTHRCLSSGNNLHVSHGHGYQRTGMEDFGAFG